MLSSCSIFFLLFIALLAAQPSLVVVVDLGSQFTQQPAEIQIGSTRARARRVTAVPSAVGQHCASHETYCTPDYDTTPKHGPMESQADLEQGFKIVQVQRHVYVEFLFDRDCTPLYLYHDLTSTQQRPRPDSDHDPFAARPLSAGPWFDGRVQGQALDYGQNDTFLDVETDVASIIDMRDVWTITERRLNSIVYGRIAGGTSNEDTLHWNVDSYREVHLRPRLLRDITNASIAVNFSLYNGAGEEFPINASSPFFFAPSGSQGLVWPDGELATIGAAAEAGVVHQETGHQPRGLLSQP
ncbi:hypothetical protein BDZ89DRAFT_1233295 [Hymenopellis radicata]|nr:hypothetical protein BDZ89DRAFT_1233295 [Hymenopellis radicata]